MSGRLIGLASLVVLLLPIRPSCAADFSEQQTYVQGEVERSRSRLVAVCKVAWTYDNLRPTVARAKWPQGTLFQPPEAPVIHLSQGSPIYRRVVGQMAYWDARSYYWEKCLLDTSRLEVADEVRSEILGIGTRLAEAKASYKEACAWAWPYSNLRPLVKQPGLEPETILNPLLTVPAVNLSPSNPDYQEIVTKLEYWEAEVRRSETRLKNYFDTNKIPLPAADAQKPPTKRRR